MNDKEKFLLERIKENMDSGKEEKERFLLKQLKESINANQKFPRAETQKNKAYIRKEVIICLSIPMVLLQT